jgi:hypothetical protein
MTAEETKTVLKVMFGGRYYVVIGKDRLTIVFATTGDTAKLKVGMPDAQVREVVEVDDLPNSTGAVLTMRLKEAT